MVGGAPVTDAWAREIGADGYAKDAFAAIQVAKHLVQLTRPSRPLMRRPDLHAVRADGGHDPASH